MYQLIVVGGGPAGIAAAIAARRQGMKTLLVERYGFLGGMATAGLVTPFMHTLGAGGLYQELLERLNKWDAIKDNRFFDGELMKLVLDEWLLEEGVEILFHALLTDVKVEDGCIKSVTVSGKGQEISLSASYFIDGTGDGDLAALAGAPMNIGRESDGLCQPMTTCFQVGGIDVGIDDTYMDAYKARKPLTELYLEAKKEGRIKNPRENVLIFPTTRTGEIHFNTTRIVGKNPVSLFELTEAELEARKQIIELFSLLKEKVLAFKNAYITRIATQIGVRESRTIIGAYQLTEEDVLSGRKFPDGIGKCSYPIDIHSPQGEGTRISTLKAGDWYEIPYTALYTPSLKNLLVAGRCISSTHEAQASLRIMPHLYGNRPGGRYCSSSGRSSETDG
ncbi:MAG: FAD-dependent oxidoreductase [Caldicoprobacterales bacterium]